MTFRNLPALLNAAVAGLLATGGATLLGVSDNVSHTHPVNHALEAPLIVGGIFTLVVGVFFAVAALVELDR